MSDLPEFAPELPATKGGSTSPLGPLAGVSINDSPDTWHILPGGLKAYTREWTSLNPTPRARLIFIHGFGDHCRNYEFFFTSLASHGITVHSFDKRGWGRTAEPKSTRGNIGTTGVILNDINSFIVAVLDQNDAESSSVPVFLMGHSMGGGEVLTFASRGPQKTRTRLRGYLAEAPFIAFPPSEAPWRIKIFLGRLAAMVLPNFKIRNDLGVEKICRDKKVQEMFLADDYCFSSCTLVGLRDLLDRTDSLDRGEVVMSGTLPGNEGKALWIGHGSGDEITWCDASTKWFAAAKPSVEDSTMKIYPKAFHRLHAEPFGVKEEFVVDVATWILDRSGSSEPRETS